MSYSKFMTLNSAECGQAYPVLQANAERHFRIAGLIATVGEYGNASSHLILGSEELLKAMVLFLDSKGLEIRKIEGVNKLFSNHKSRHNVLKEVFSVWRFLRPIITMQEINVSNVLSGILKGGLNAIANHYWWEKADNIKQRGFYVDYAETFIDPSSITKNDYKEASRHVEAIKKEITEAIRHIEKMSAAELADLKQNIIDGDLHSLLKVTIAGRKKTNDY
ncbi:MAG TPA: AbiV family abortive infection protein [Puia sp.]|jgi:AbiV family abortive infection protein|nr:AbiV family abortive infection protein [Puia sp.]